MGHSTYKGITKSVLDAPSEMKLCNLLRVLVDAPNKKWPFLEQLTSNLHDKYQPAILFFSWGKPMSSMGPFKHAMKLLNRIFNFSWNHSQAFFFLKKTSLSGRYRELADSTVFPQRYCTVKRVENVVVCHRGLDVFKYTKMYLSKAKKLPSAFIEACAYLSPFIFFNLTPFLNMCRDLTKVDYLMIILIKINNSRISYSGENESTLT